MGWGIKPVALLALLWPQLAASRQHDPGGDRLETFQQSNLGRRQGEPIRNCTQDRIWCAELLFPSRGRTGPWELRVIARATNRDPQERRWRYVLPEQWRMGAITGTGIWTEIVRDAWGGALIGLDLIRETRRPRFRSYQRRLALLHIPSGTGGQPTVVLETPLSGFIEQSMCPSPDPTGQASAPAEDDSQHPRALSDAEAARLNACVDDFYYRTQFTLPESHQPSGQPPDLIVATVATTLPGRRPRTPPGTLREPIVRTEDDIVRDPACTFTRTYYFDAAQGRYVPDAPLPACRDYLEP